MIEVSHLTKYYGSFLAVDDLSFTIPDGHVYGFLGPNGAGKSTTMNIMTGCLSPTEGKVMIDGHDILAEPEAAKRCMGYLPEQPPLYPEMTVQEYLDFAAELKGVKKAQRREQVQQAARRTGLDQVMPRLIRNLSKGYRQRVGLAQAILGDPEVLACLELLQVIVVDHDGDLPAFDDVQLSEVLELEEYVLDVQGDRLAQARHYSGMAAEISGGSSSF